MVSLVSCVKNLTLLKKRSGLLSSASVDGNLWHLVCLGALGHIVEQCDLFRVGASHSPVVLGWGLPTQKDYMS